MGAVSYKIKAFDPEEAASGALCIVTSEEFTEGDSTTPDATWNERVEGQTEPIQHKTVVGTGICRRSSNQFVITIGSTNYLFKTDGNGYSVNAKDKYIYLCEVNDDTQVVGNTAIINDYVVVNENNKLTRSPIADGANRGYNIHELNARDEFAAQALRGILARIDNPSVLSENEIQFYCDAAYKWADKMILETAKRRVLGDENIPTGTTGGSESSTTINQTYTVSEQELKNIADNIKNLNISVKAGDTTVDIDTDGLIKALTGKDNKGSVGSGDDVASKLDDIVRGLIGKGVNDANIAEFKSLLQSLDDMSNVEKGVPIRNYENDEGEPLPLKMQVENTIDQGTSNPFIVASTVVNAKGSNDRTIPLAVSASIDSIDMPGDDANNPIYVENTGAVTLKNDSDNGTDIPLKVENSGELEVSIKNSTTGGNPTPLAVSTDIQEELSDIKESIDNLIDWEKAYEVGTAAISTTAGLFNLRPLPDNVLKMRMRIYDGNGDKVNITPDTLATYQWFNNENAVTDLSDSIYFKDIIGALRDEPSETVTHLQIGSQSINNSQYNTPIKIVVDYVYGNTGSNSTSRTVSGSLNVSEQNTDRTIVGNVSITNAMTSDDLGYQTPVPLKVEADINGGGETPWTLVGVIAEESQYFYVPYIEDHINHVKIEQTDTYEHQRDTTGTYKIQWVDVDKNPIGSEIDVKFDSIPYYLKKNRRYDNNSYGLRIRGVNSNIYVNDKLFVYISGDALYSFSGSGGGSTDVSGIVTALNNLTGSKTKDRTIDSIPDLNIGNKSGDRLNVKFGSYDQGCSAGYPFHTSVRLRNDSGNTIGVSNSELMCKNTVSFASNQSIKVSEQVKDRTISTMPSLSGSFNVSEQNTSRSVSFTSGTSLNVSMPNAVRTDTDSLVNGCIIFGNNDNYGIEPRGTGGYCHIGLDDKRFNEIFGDTITCNVLYVGDKDQNSQTYFSVNQAGQVKGTKFEVAGGTTAGFLKANGDIDTSYYIKEDSSKDVYLRNNLYLGTDKKIAFGINNECITCDDSIRIPYNGFVMHNGMLSLKHSGTNTHYARQWLTESSAGLVHHFGCYDSSGTSEIAYTKYYFEGEVRIQNKKLYIIDSDVSSTFSIGDFANDGTVTFKNDANDFKFEGSVYSNNELLTSDITLKDVLSEEEFEVGKLAEMPLVKFTWKDEKKDKKVHFGSIAQEWEKVLPEVVSKGSDDKLYLDYNGASMAAGVTACREIVKMKEGMEALKKENEYLKKELEAIKEIVYGKEKDDMED